MNVRKRYPLWLAALSLLISSLACSAGGLFSNEVDTPERQVAASAEAAAEADRVLVDSAGSGTIRMTEAQFTSFLARQLAEEGAESPIDDLTVWFEPGELILAGTPSDANLPVDGKLIMRGKLSADDGQVHFSIEEASAGGIRLPSAVIGILNDQIESALSVSALNRARIRTIRIEQGVIEIERE